MILKIVSGGQTGVDRAALDAAIIAGLPHGGWCPKRRLAEDGVISNAYALRETESDDYKERTLLNIRDSDATLIVVGDQCHVEHISDGTRLTIDELNKVMKPHLIISLPMQSQCHNEHIVNQVCDWLVMHRIAVLNIAGPRQSSLAIYDTAVHFLVQLFAKLHQY